MPMTFVMFVVPTEQDIRAVNTILELFAAASRLHTNVSKCQFTPIQCTDDQIAVVNHWFPCPFVQFPFKYLGVPLSIYQLKKIDLHLLVDDVADRLPTWKSRLMSKAGRTTLMKVTLSEILIHISIVVKVSPWIYSAIDMLHRDFIWTVTETTSGGKCLVAWAMMARPTELGGLGTFYLTTLGYTLRLRWEWLQRTDPSRMWSALPSKEDRIVQVMFTALVSVHVGNGDQARFWSDRWLDGESIESSFPLLVAVVSKRIRKCRTVRQALHNDQWVHDISGALSVQALQQYIVLWERISVISLALDTPDKFIWKWSASQQYSATSTYRAFFHGQCGLLGAKELAKAGALLVASSLCGCPFWSVVGFQRDADVTIYRMTTLVRSTGKVLKPWNIYC
jgi:hypothetical protein